MPRSPRRVTLDFDRAANDGADEAHPRLDLSVVLQIGDDLWLAADESATLERLSPDGGSRFARHRRFALADYVDLPAAADDEVDIEGMAFDGRALWVVGSHGARRGSPHVDEEPRKAQLRRLAKIKRGGNRYLLARIPLVPDPDSPNGHSYVPCARRAVSGNDASSASSAKGGDGEITAARLLGGRRRDVLVDAIRHDEHLAPYLAIPSKDNGFDVEGLATLGTRLFVGLRGPVINGWAVILEIAVRDARRGRLDLEPIGRRGRPYRKHFVDVRGMGVRELSADGDALLILAGPTMKLDGSAALFRWTAPPPGKRGDTLTPRGEVPKLLALPYGPGEREDLDHAEGLTFLAGRKREVLVAYDSPDPSRKVGETGVQLDVFELP